ncbi:peptide-methionine (S)-S-oxide reductase MsrA [Azoarcus sp. L1K30]|uniref:peptide-methionine (S)-S-oxide reductase MsrA n=1 Tax=Azoarcus sp. L1K30 TaxID=2820277 RepID=UPI001B82A53B|nr:peptide-methionine (S)-S-oxide reductase MsrA [Azoarcus sp. L1K30]MBR0567328.1 peptide-methionine (S)-S-oxide reductase MsrA [Azoarcus sp. L1K30]
MRSKLRPLCLAALWAFALAGSAHAADGSAVEPASGERETAIFAGGCFWCTEADFEKLPGVIEAESGYTGGKEPDPSYAQVSAGNTGHAEAVRVIYDPARVTYPQLVEYFWRTIDPTARNRQFCDVGSQYRTGIYWQTERERKVAEDSRDALLRSGKVSRVLTEILPATAFYPAEEYHQDYYKKNPLRYMYYRRGCGRDAQLGRIWGPR